MEWIEEVSFLKRCYCARKSTKVSIKDSCMKAIKDAKKAWHSMPPLRRSKISDGKLFFVLCVQYNKIDWIRFRFLLISLLRFYFNPFSSLSLFHQHNQSTQSKGTCHIHIFNINNSGDF